MENLKSLLTQSPYWTFSKNKITLQAGNEFIVEIVEHEPESTTFVLEDKQYSIQKHGLWNPVTLIQKEGNTVLELRNQLFGNKGKAEFNGGRIYPYKIVNTPLATLSFSQTDGRDVLSYKIEATGNQASTRLVMNLHDTGIPDEDLLMLIILGCYTFKDIVKENVDSDVTPIMMTILMT